MSGVITAAILRDYMVQIIDWEWFTAVPSLPHGR